MTYKRKSWQEKLADSKDLPRVCDATKSKRGGTGTFVIPAPLEVDSLMKKVRRGKLTTIEVIERDGQVYWYPSRDTQPAFAD